MEFRIADSFTDSLARLTGDEQKSVKTTAFDLQMNPASPGMQFHKLDKAKDKNFWSVRVSRDIRLIVHKTDSSLLLCYVDHHDDAYRWAERRRLEVHPKTGAAQFVVIRETVLEIAVRRAVEVVAQKPKLFADRSDAQLLSYGVPPEWLADVRQANEDTLLDIAAYLPAEAAEALLQAATGGETIAPSLATLRSVPDETADVSLNDAGLNLEILESDWSREPESSRAGFAHPDAQRRFRLIENREELERALEYPWEKWTTFLHPAQREVVEGKYSGPARVSGSAGTGKTIVALHRAVQLARANSDARVLLATFSETLSHALRTRLRRLIGNEPRLGERIDVHALDAVGIRLHKAHVGPLTLVGRDELLSLLRAASDAVGGHKFGMRFLITEWEEIVDAWQLQSWDSYRDVARLGRKTRLSEAQRRVLWSIFERLIAQLSARNLRTPAGMFTALASRMKDVKNPPFDFAVVDESQDLSVSQLKFLAALGASRPDALFFAGDLGQRIFQQPFSWKSLGVDVRGRSKTLRVNYRTSHQIRSQADQLLNADVMDVDGNCERRADTVSVFNGTEPMVLKLESPEAETSAVAKWLSDRATEGLAHHELAVFVRSHAEIERAKAAMDAAKLPFKVLDEHVETVSGHASLCTMHLAKGLEFRGVAVMACDDEIIPSQERIAAAGDDADLQEIYETERHLLYVACTRARDHLLVTAVEPHSEFLDDLVRASFHSSMRVNRQ
jgi:mRNA-degrading endonuclease RelE of RelBE toxin-antitoxin system